METKLKVDGVACVVKPVSISANPRCYYWVKGVQGLTLRGTAVLEAIAIKSSKRHACGIVGCSETPHRAPATFYVSFGFDPEAPSTLERLQRYYEEVRKGFSHWLGELKPKDYDLYFILG